MFNVAASGYSRSTADTSPAMAAMVGPGAAPAHRHVGAVNTLAQGRMTPVTGGVLSRTG
jgi:hypothetical protein